MTLEQEEAWEVAVRKAQFRVGMENKAGGKGLPDEAIPVHPRAILAVDAELTRLKAEVERLTKERNDMQMLAGKFTTEIRILQERITDERESIVAERKAIAEAVENEALGKQMFYHLADRIEYGEFSPNNQHKEM